MRLQEPDRQEERLFAVLQFAQRLHAQFRDRAVGVRVVRHIRHLGSRAAGCPAERLAGQSSFFRFGAAAGHDLAVLVGHIASAARGPASRFAPRRSVVVAPVIDLAHADAGVAVLLEMLAQRHDVGDMRAEVRFQIVDLRRIGAQPRHQAGPRRRADGLLAIRSQENRAVLRQSVDVRTADVIGPVTAQFGAQVIDRNEQHIRPLLGRSRHSDKQPTHQR
jgi:hypothetical protein